MNNNNQYSQREPKNLYSIEDIADSHKFVLLDNCALEMPSHLTRNGKWLNYMSPFLINSYQLQFNAFFNSFKGRKNIGMVPEAISEWNEFEHMVKRFHQGEKAVLKTEAYKRSFDLGNDEYHTRSTRDSIGQIIQICHSFKHRFRKNFVDSIKEYKEKYNGIFNLLYDIVSDSAIYLWDNGANKKYNPTEQKSDTDERLLAHSFAFSLTGYGNIALITSDMRIHKMASIIQRIMTSDTDIPYIFDALDSNPVNLFCNHESLPGIYCYLKKPNYGKEYPTDFPNSSFEKIMRLEEILSSEMLKDNKP